VAHAPIRVEHQPRAPHVDELQPAQVEHDERHLRLSGAQICLEHRHGGEVKLAAHHSHA
jgi:hypothetical protein